MTHFDKNKLLKSISNNDEFLNDLMHVSASSLKKYYADLSEAVKDRNIDSIFTHAHSIHGMAVSMYFVRLADLAQNIEYKSKNNSFYELMQGMPQFIHEIEYLLNNVLNDY